MIAQINTVAFLGIEVRKIEIQVHIATGGLPSFNIVGLPDKTVAESKERVRAAFSSIALGIPPKRITINMSPADILKEGSHFDLGIAVGLLIAMQIIPQEEIIDYIVMGELALDATVTRVNGVLPTAIAASGFGMGLVCPWNNHKEAVYSGNNAIVAVKNLIELVNHFTGKQLLNLSMQVTQPQSIPYPDLADVRGQYMAKKALEIAAAGGHHMLMIGPPGSGKSMLAKRLPGIMPPLSPKERLDASIIASIAGTLAPENGLVDHRPFRSPHCSSSMPAMVGGGRNAIPGEVTLAHLGILFLDELPEFSKLLLESLRQPVEDGQITIARVHTHITYPAKFQLIAAMNPCKCGYYGSVNSNIMCKRAPKCAYDYQDRVSGPMFDRFDLQVETVGINSTDIQLKQQVPGERSALVAKRVLTARQIQHERYNKLGIDITSNARLEGDDLHKCAELDDHALDTLERAAARFSLSMRGINRVLKVALTIADLQEHYGKLQHSHVAEALNYRISRVR